MSRDDQFILLRCRSIFPSIFRVLYLQFYANLCIYIFCVGNATLNSWLLKIMSIHPKTDSEIDFLWIGNLYMAYWLN